MVSALLSSLHVLAFGIGLPGVFLRGLSLRSKTFDDVTLKRLFAADAAWGVAALLWLATGLLRALGPFEKGSAYYLHSGPFLVKMALFTAIFLLEVAPMTAFIRWRIALSKHQPINTSRVPLYRRINDIELVLLLAMPFLASAMARGFGFGWFD